MAKMVHYILVFIIVRNATLCTAADLSINIYIQNVEEWHHLAFVYNSGTHVRKIYFDGELLTYCVSQDKENLHSTVPF